MPTGTPTIWSEFQEWIFAGVALLISILGFLAKRAIGAMDVRVAHLEDKASEQEEFLGELDKEIEVNTKMDQVFRENMKEDMDELKIGQKESAKILAKLYTAVELIKEQRIK